MADAERHVGVAGASACAEALRLEERLKAIRAARGPIGRAFTDLFPSQTERRLRREHANWRTGAEGEWTLAAALVKHCPEVSVLADRRQPGSRANIDLIALAPSGVYVIDCKRYKGKIEVAAPLFGQPKLRIAGRDRTKLIDGLERQVEHVRAALAEPGPTIHGCLCFVAPEGIMADVGLPLFRTPKIRGYRLYQPRSLARRLNGKGPLSPSQMGSLHADLARLLPAASHAAGGAAA